VRCAGSVLNTVLLGSIWPCDCVPGHGSPVVFIAFACSNAACSLAIPFLASAIALSHPLKFILTPLSRLLNLAFMTESSDYRKAYEAAKQELIDLLSQQERVEKRLVVVRQSIQTLAELCEGEGIDVDPSDEADALIDKSSLAEEIRTILQSQYPGWLRPSMVKQHLGRLGHDLSEYKNPQATIHMVLKRLVESGDVQETTTPDDGKKIYRKPPLVWTRSMQAHAKLEMRAYAKLERGTARQTPRKE